MKKSQLYDELADLIEQINELSNDVYLMSKKFDSLPIDSDVIIDLKGFIYDADNDLRRCSRALGSITADDMLRAFSLSEKQ